MNVFFVEFEMNAINRGVSECMWTCALLAVACMSCVMVF
jgi:hypothetical protein